MGGDWIIQFGRDLAAIVWSVALSGVQQKDSIFSFPAPLHSTCINSPCLDSQHCFRTTSHHTLNMLAARLIDPIETLTNKRLEFSLFMLFTLKHLLEQHEACEIHAGVIRPFFFLVQRELSQQQQQSFGCRLNLGLIFYPVCSRWLRSQWRMWVTCKINVMRRGKKAIFVITVVFFFFFATS